MNVLLFLHAFSNAFTRLSVSEKEFDQRAQNTVYINDMGNPSDIFDRLTSFISLRSEDICNATCKEELESMYINCRPEFFMLIYYKEDVHNIVKITRKKDLIELICYVQKWEYDDLQKLKNLGFSENDQLYLKFKMMYSSIRRRLCN